MSGIIAINEAVKENLEENFPNLKDNIIVLPNGVDIDSINYTHDKDTARKNLGLPKNEKIALYIGSFQDWKGVEVIIKGAEGADEISFYLVGGSKEEALKLDGIKNIPDNVHIIDRRDYKEMPLWLRAADVMIVTGTRKDNYSFYYTSPMKLFEYMAVNKPILASKTYAIQQAVSEKEVFFHEVDDPNDFRDKIKFIVSNFDIANKKIEHAKKKVIMLSWENRANKVRSFIKEKI